MMCELLQIVPEPGQPIHWQRIETLLADLVQPMSETPQNPRWHGEGDVWTHTKLVAQALTGLEAYRKLDRRKQQILFLAALFHDAGKPRTTRLEDGQWVSGGHAAVGAQLARQKMWLEFGLCGGEDKLRFRETVCALVRYHSTPPHAIDDPDGKRRLLRIAANGAQLGDFSIELLCILSEADILGRYCEDQLPQLEQVALCRELAREAECFQKAYDFPSAHTKFAYFSGKNVLPDQALYDDTWGTVIMLCGLPGTGKDTWISRAYPHQPMISLDEIRRELGITPTENQTRVVEEGRRRAKEYLRAKVPFVWNATDLSHLVRRRQIELFTSYHAAVSVVYLETDWEEQLRRNQARLHTVPEQAIRGMLEKLVPPEDSEAHRVRWHSV